MEKNDLLNMPFDQYQRYRHVADIIEQIRKRDQRLQILELGSNYQMNLKRFVPNDEVFCVDMAYPTSQDELKDSVFFVLSDAMQVPFSDNSFDVVVALDVFEHIESDKRRFLLMEMVRLSKRCSILGGPFDTEDIAVHEMLLNEYFKTLAGFDHPWLKEHINKKLPDLEWTVGELRKNGLIVSIFENGYLPRWAKMMRMHLFVAASGGLIPYLDRIYSFYNKIFYEYDNKAPSYRKILVFSEEELEIKSYVKTEDDYSKGNEKILGELISSLYQLSNRIGLQNYTQQLQAKDNLIQGQAQQIEAKNSVIQDQAQQISAKDMLIQQNTQRIEGIEKQIQAKDVHIQNIENQLQAKDTHIGNLVEQIEHVNKELQAKDSLIKEQAQQIEAKDTHIHNIEFELNLMKGSKAWRTAEFLRRILYHKI